MLLILYECNLWLSLVGDSVHCPTGSSASIPNAQRWPLAVTAGQLSMLISKCFVKDYSKINSTA